MFNRLKEGRLKAEGRDEDRLPLDPRYGKVAPTLVTCPGRQESRLKAVATERLVEEKLGHRFFPVDIVGDLERCRDCGKHFDIHNLQVPSRLKAEGC